MADDQQKTSDLGEDQGVGGNTLGDTGDVGLSVTLSDIASGPSGSLDSVGGVGKSPQGDIPTGQPVNPGSLAPFSPGPSGREREVPDLKALEQKVELEELGKEMEIEKELEQMGVEKRPTEFTVPRDVTKAGVEVVPGPELPVLPAQPILTVPLTDEKISYGIKQRMATSIRWLAEWCVKQFKKARIKIKFVHGQLVRVLAP